MTPRRRASLETFPVAEIERDIISKVAKASFPPSTAAKRFMRDLDSGYVTHLSRRGRMFLAYIAHRFRRQYVLTEPEWAWVRDWLQARAEWTAARQRLPESLERYLNATEGQQ